MTDIGKISFVYKGDYDESATYEEKDCVTYNGSTFCALKAVTGVAPAHDHVNWWQMSKGTKGSGETILPDEPVEQENGAFWLLEY